MKYNKIVVLFVIIIIACMAFTNIYAGPTDPGVGTVPSALTTTAPKIWGTVSYVVQTISIACIVFAGLRYMFSSSSGKADIKSSMIYLIVGSVLVFGTVTVIQLVADII